MSTDYITIPLTQDQETIVDTIDADLAQLKWFSDKGYATRHIPGDHKKRVTIHRIVLERILQRSLEKDELCDHVDGNPHNNRRDNLRIATRSQNSINSKCYKSNTSGCTGVVRNKGRGNPWIVTINVKGQRIYLGIFSTYEDAVKARKMAEKEYHGDYAPRD